VWQIRVLIQPAPLSRPSLVFGPEDQFFNKFNKFPLPFLPLVGGGRTKFQPVYVEDVTGPPRPPEYPASHPSATADAMVACADGKTGRGQTFELGGPDVFTFAQLMSKCSNKPGLPIPFFAAEVPPAPSSLWCVSGGSHSLHTPCLFLCLTPPPHRRCRGGSWSG
jgi:nucleoside-diphosphate-sugar epimerase